MVALPAPPSPTTRPVPSPTPLHNPTHFSTLFPNPQPVNTHLVHSPTLTPYSIPHLPQHMGANPGRIRDASSPRIRQHSPNTFNVQVAYRYSKLGISKRDFFLVFTSFWAKNWASANVMTFFGLYFILGKKLGISKRDDLFLVFTSFWAKNWASADVSILLNHPLNAQHRFAPPPLHPQHLFPPCTPVSFD